MMSHVQEALKSLADFVNKNPPVVILAFIASAIANISQIATYLRDKRRLRHEMRQNSYLARLVETYEDVLKIAKETVGDQTRLLAIRKEISESKSAAEELVSRNTALENAVKKRMVAQAIEYNLDLLEKTYGELQALREQNQQYGDLPELPADTRIAVASEIQMALHRPYTLPREFAFTSGLLVLIVLLVPWPVEGLMLPFLLRYFLLAVFDSVSLFPRNRPKRWVIRHYSVLVFLAAYGVWLGFVRAILGIFAPLITPVLVGLAAGITKFEFGNVNPYLVGSISVIPEVAPALIALLLALPEWRALRKEIKTNSLPKLLASIDADGEE